MWFTYRNHICLKCVFNNNNFSFFYAFLVASFPEEYSYPVNFSGNSCFYSVINLFLRDILTPNWKRSVFFYFEIRKVSVSKNDFDLWWLLSRFFKILLLYFFSNFFLIAHLIAVASQQVKNELCQKMLTYLQVHIYYTLPPTIILYLLMRPLIGSFDKIKIITLCTLALVYTTPWDNYIIYHKAWWYRKDAVIGTIGYVPIEEYLFFIIQTILTALWTTFCSRWTLNSLHLQHSNRVNFYMTRNAVISILLISMITGFTYAIPATKTFYMGSIVWWTLFVVIVLWYMCGPYVIKRYRETLISILVPSLYLCYVDLIALRAQVWHINEATSLEIFPVDDLPLEGNFTQIVFFSLYSPAKNHFIV